MEEKLHFTEKEAQATDPEISVQRKKRIRPCLHYTYLPW